MLALDSHFLLRVVMQSRTLIYIALLLAAVSSALSAEELPALTSLSNAHLEFTVPDADYVVLKRGDIETVIVNNEAVDDDVLKAHRAGYSGVAKLTHTKHKQNLFVPGIAGLNYEHIHDGTVQPRKTLFEPRNAPMQLRVIDEHTVELYQAPTPKFKLESVLRYQLIGDNTIEMTLECIPRERTFTNNYVGLFWASYIHKPESKDIHFLGFPNAEANPQEPTGKPVWIRGITPSHGVEATHLRWNDKRKFAHDEEFPLTLVFNRSKHRYDVPMYYGVSNGMAWICMFRDKDDMRLSQSPSGGGNGNPAWDFQYFIPDYKVNTRYQMIMRAKYVPYSSQEQILKDSAAHMKALNK